MQIAEVSTERTKHTVATLAYDLNDRREHFFINALVPERLFVAELVKNRSAVRSSWMQAAQDILNTLHPNANVRLRRINLNTRVRQKVDTKYSEYLDRVRNRQGAAIC